MCCDAFPRISRVFHGIHERYGTIFEFFALPMGAARRWVGRQGPFEFERDGPHRRRRGTSPFVSLFKWRCAIEAIVARKLMRHSPRWARRQDNSESKIIT